MSSSHPVGFRVPNDAFEFYSLKAGQDHRKVGEYMKVVLVNVQGIVRACSALRLTPDEILERAGLGDYACPASPAPSDQEVTARETVSSL